MRSASRQCAAERDGLVGIGLQLAAAVGLLPVEEPGVEGGAAIRGPILYYDPDLAPSERLVAIACAVTIGIRDKRIRVVVES